MGFLVEGLSIWRDTNTLTRLAGSFPKRLVHKRPRPAFGTASCLREEKFSTSSVLGEARCSNQVRRIAPPAAKQPLPPDPTVTPCNHLITTASSSTRAILCRSLSQIYLSGKILTCRIKARMYSNADDARLGKDRNIQSSPCASRPTDP
jgi:hypothetical protein